MVSLIVAMVVLVLTLSWSVGGTTVYAASMDPDSITTFDGDNTTDGVTRATEDSTNGLTISYNNDGGSLSAPVKMLLVLTILSLAPSILIMLTSYTKIIIAFSAYCNRNADRTTKSGIDRIGFIFDIFHYVADIPTDQYRGNPAS